MGLSIKAKITVVILFLVIASNIIIGSYLTHILKEGIITPEKVGDILKEKEVLIVAISTFLLVLVIAVIFAVTLVEPVDKLIVGTHLVAEGKLDYEIKKQSTDEIGRLVDAFNEMIRKLRKSIEKETKSTQTAFIEKTKAELIVDSMADGVIVTDNEQNIVLFNKAAEKIFNINSKTILSKHLLHLSKFGFSQVFYDILEEKEKRSRKKNRIIVHEAEIHAPEEKNISITISTLKDERGESEGNVIVIQDITKLKEVENLKNEFISVVSHELRTPLTSILGYAQLLSHKKLGDLTEKQERAMGIINKESQLLHALINDLLDLSKLESGKVQLKNEATDLVELIKQCPALHQAKEKEISVKISVPKDFPKVYIDQGKMMQVFTNLISNAAKFTPKSGKMLFMFQRKKDTIRVSIKDTGIGIAKKDIPHLFEKFFQVESHLTRNKGGTGLGLSIVKEIINLYGGVITVSSKLHRGTTFSFTLPLLKPKEGEQQTPEKMKEIADGIYGKAS